MSIRKVPVNTHLEVEVLRPGNYQVKAVQGQVATKHQLTVDPQFLDRMGLAAFDGTTVVREVCDILVEHEALTAVPAEATLEQLVGHYPYLASGLQERLCPASPELPAVESVRIIPRPAEDRPTHT
jgi:hypothetical protein